MIAFTIVLILIFLSPLLLVGVWLSIVYNCKQAEQLFNKAMADTEEELDYRAAHPEIRKYTKE